jgi:hypothetical protein
MLEVGTSIKVSHGRASLGPVAAELAPYRGRAIFFEPLEGNNGDKLIQLGSRTLLRSLGVILMREPKHAEVIVFNGGFAMSDI